MRLASVTTVITLLLVNTLVVGYSGLGFESFLLYLASDGKVLDLTVVAQTGNFYQQVIFKFTFWSPFTSYINNIKLITDQHPTEAM